MTKKTNLKTLMAGTTTLLMGLNVFVSPVQAAEQGKSSAALAASQTTGKGSNPNSNDAEAATQSASAPVSDSEQQDGQKDGDQNKADSQSQPQVTSDQESDDNNSDTKSVTEKSSIYEDNTKVKDENGNETTIGEVAKNQHDNNALGLAGMFGIFSKETTIGADANSNIATKEYLSGSEFGTWDNTINHNLIDKDINYIDKIDDMGAQAFRGKNVAVIGKNDNVTIKGIQVSVNGHRLDKLTTPDLRKEYEIDSNNPNKKYIDIDAEFEELEKKSDYFSNHKVDSNAKVDLGDMNNRSIDVSNAHPDKNNAIYVDLDAGILDAPQPVKILGLDNVKSSVNGTPTLIINVKNIQNNELNVGTQIKIYYNNVDMASHEYHDHANQILWNFGNELSALNINSGYFMGSILAPKATVNVNVNADGNIVANTVNVSHGEFHHWDLHPGDSFIEILNPNKDHDGGKDQDGNKGHDGNKDQDNNTTPEKPKGEKPGFPWFPSPAYPEIPGNENPDQPQTPNITTPNFSEPKSKTPFPDSETVTPSKPKNDVKSFFKAQAKKHVVTKNVAKKTAVDKKKPVTQAPKIEVEHNKVNTAKAVTVATPKSMVERGSVEKVSVKKSAPKAAALPQTGQKQNQSVLIGIALSAVALIVGFFGRAKKN